jgi:hypothetical protein
MINIENEINKEEIFDQFEQIYRGFEQINNILIEYDTRMRNLESNLVNRIKEIESDLIREEKERIKENS